MSGTRRRFGAARRLANGRWQARYRDARGRMVSPTPGTTYRTKTEVDRLLAAVETDLRRGVHFDHRSGRTRVAALAESHLAGAQGRLKPKTAASYRSLLDAVILPSWAEVELAASAPPMCARGSPPCPPEACPPPAFARRPAYSSASSTTRSVTARSPPTRRPARNSRACPA